MSPELALLLLQAQQGSTQPDPNAPPGPGNPYWPAGASPPFGQAPTMGMAPPVALQFDPMVDAPPPPSPVPTPELDAQMDAIVNRQMPLEAPPAAPAVDPMAPVPGYMEQSQQDLSAARIPPNPYRNEKYSAIMQGADLEAQKAEKDAEVSAVEAESLASIVDARQESINKENRILAAQTRAFNRMIAEKNQFIERNTAELRAAQDEMSQIGARKSLGSGAGNKIGAAVAILLGGIGQYLTGGDSNVVVQQLNELADQRSKQIDQEIQKGNIKISSKLQAARDYLVSYGSDVQQKQFMLGVTQKAIAEQLQDTVKSIKDKALATQLESLAEKNTLDANQRITGVMANIAEEKAKMYDRSANVTAEKAQDALNEKVLADAGLPQLPTFNAVTGGDPKTAAKMTSEAIRFKEQGDALNTSFNNLMRLTDTIQPAKWQSEGVGKVKAEIDSLAPLISVVFGQGSLVGKEKSDFQATYGKIADPRFYATSSRAQVKAALETLKRNANNWLGAEIKARGRNPKFVGGSNVKVVR